jgi:mycothiol system anti-sigma-R factor
MNLGNGGCENCDQAMEVLDQYVDRELTTPELAEVRRHLEGCPPCQRHFDFEEKMKVLVYRKACPEKAPHQLLAKILSSIGPRAVRES